MNLAEEALLSHNFAISISNEIGRADPWRLWDKSFPLYNPSEFITSRGYSTIDKIRRDEQVKSALLYKKHAILSSGWQVVSPKGQEKDWEVREFVENQLTGLKGTLESNLIEILTALDYGFSISEIIYERVDNLIGLKAIKTRKPHDILFKQDKHGNLLEIVQETPDGQITLPLDRMILFTFQPEFSNAYGRSDLESAYRSWWHKESAYRYLGMYLERLGIPPIFVLYNRSAFQGANTSKLESILKRIQSGTVGMIPRDSKEDLDIWSPELAAGVAQVFLPALQMFDGHIARALLMPAQLGVSPETGVGSLARAEIIFDLFLYMIESIRKTLEETIMNEQLVKPLVDLNFTVDEYPKWELIPLKEDVKTELFTTWLQMVDKGITVPTEQDEAHIRNSLEFPEREEGQEDIRQGGPHDPQVRLDMEREQQEQLRKNQKSPDNDKKKQPAKFAQEDDDEKILAIRDDIERLESGFAADLTWAIEKMIDAYITKVRLGKVTLENIDQIDMGSTTSLESIFYRHTLESYQQGLDFMKTSIGMKLQEYPIDTVSFVKKFLKTRALIFAKNFVADLLDGSRQALLLAFRLNEDDGQMATRLKRFFNRFVAPPDELEAGRAKVIARTELTAAWNHGIVSVARDRRFADLVEGMRYSAILDTVTTPVCRHLHGKIFQPSDPVMLRLSPPNHYNCRSRLVAVSITRRLREEDYITEEQKAKGLKLAMVGFT
jgi:SPP1 gp7 family putative phage head morphogenesis protein